MQIPTIDDLALQGTPQWFGLGFVQLKISATQRYHFWHPDLAPDVGAEEVHDHRYAFTSHVLRGSIRNEIYQYGIVDNGPMLMESVSCKPGDESETIAHVTCEMISSTVMTAGSHYFMRADVFHRSIVEKKAVTLLTRNAVLKEFARVIRPKDNARVCPFTNVKPKEELWAIVEDCLHDRPGYHLADIEKGTLGEPSKIVEEARELLDAHEQGSRIMASVELSDLYGAMKAYMVAHQPGLTFDDLAVMSDITARAFRNGRR